MDLAETVRLSARELANYTGLSVRVVEKYAKEGALPAFQPRPAHGRLHPALPRTDEEQFLPKFGQHKRSHFSK